MQLTFKIRHTLNRVGNDLPLCFVLMPFDKKLVVFFSEYESVARLSAKEA
ncbi:MAG: hypothetical protein WAM14_06805 [Candidatus Nitrosopolaris sp.]